MIVRLVTLALAGALSLDAARRGWTGYLAFYGVIYVLSIVGAVRDMQRRL